MPTKLVVGLLCGAALLLSGVACAAPAAPSGEHGPIIAAVETVVAGSVEATLTASAQAMPTAAPMATPSPDAPQVACRLWLTATMDVPFREGPGTDYPPMGQMLAGQSAEVLSHDGYYSWWLVPLIDGRKAWVPGTAVRLSDCANYPPVLTQLEPRRGLLRIGLLHDHHHPRPARLAHVPPGLIRKVPVRWLIEVRRQNDVRDSRTSLDRRYVVGRTERCGCLRAGRPAAPPPLIARLGRLRRRDRANYLYRIIERPATVKSKGLYLARSGA